MVYRLYPSYFITGASSGIGYALALELAHRAAHASPPQQQPIALALTARRVDRLDRLATHIRQIYPKAVVKVCGLDVNDGDQAMRSAIEECHNALGPLHCFVVNAGIANEPRAVGSKDGFDMDKKVIQTNLVGAMTTIEYAMAYFRQYQVYESSVGAGLVAISSIAGSTPVPSAAAYAASKAGLDAYVESLRLENAKNPGLHITNIRPGLIETDINVQHHKNKPFMISAPKAARLIVDHMVHRSSSVIVPWFPYRIVLFMIHLLPTFIVLSLFRFFKDFNVAEKAANVMSSQKKRVDGMAHASMAAVTSSMGKMTGGGGGGSGGSSGRSESAKGK